MTRSSSSPARARRTSAAHAPASRSRRLPLAAPLVIALTCAAVYANSLRGPFLFDDRLAIEENASIRDLASIGRVLRPPEHTPVSGRPLVNLSFAINFAVGGLDVRGYHAVNAAMHLLTALVLLGILRRTFARQPGLTPGDAAALAAAATLAWAVHPLNSEVVNYLTQRSEAMMGLFVLLAVYCAIRAVDTADPPAILTRNPPSGLRSPADPPAETLARNPPSGLRSPADPPVETSARNPLSGRWAIGAGVAAACGVASKEVALTLPLVIALWDRTFAFPTFRAAWAARRGVYALVASSWLVFLLAGRTFDSTASAGGLSTSSWTYLMNQGPMVLRYLTLSVWPDALVFDYGVVQALTIRDVWPSLLVTGALLLMSAAALRVRAPAGFWAAWFFLMLAPTTSVMPIPTEVGAERRMYLPLVAVCVLVVTAAHAVWQRRAGQPGVRRAGWALAVVAICALAAVTVRRNAEYRTGLSIWQTVVARRPHWRAHEHLSVYLRDAGRVDDSIAHLRQAAAESARSRHALAAALLERGDAAKAVVQYRELLRQWPDDPDIVLARRGLALALMASGDMAGALDERRTLVAQWPDEVRYRIELGELLGRTGDQAGAIEEYRAAVRLQPGNVVALSNLGVLLATAGHDEEALPILLRAMALDPGGVAVRQQITQVFLVRGQFVEAEQHARSLVTLAPAHAEAHNLLGVALASMKRFPEAADAFAEAVRLAPGHADARANLARIRGR